MHLTGANVIMGMPEGHFDGHAHVFTADLPMVRQRRYTPDYDATIADYVNLLRDNHLGGALLIQPSFLGTDNSFLLETLAQATTITDMVFRGVVMLNPDTADDEIARLNESGVVGFRLNLVGQASRFDIEDWAGLLKKLDRHDWHVELHCEGDHLPQILPGLLKHAPKVVVDHFGLPGCVTPTACAGKSALLDVKDDRLFVKVSAPYRAFPDVKFADRTVLGSLVFRKLFDQLGPARLVWGSDWPWTRFERQHSYSDTLEWLDHWIQGYGSLQ